MTTTQTIVPRGWRWLCAALVATATIVPAIPLAACGGSKPANGPTAGGSASFSFGGGSGSASAPPQQSSNAPNGMASNGAPPPPSASASMQPYGPVTMDPAQLAALVAAAAAAGQAMMQQPGAVTGDPIEAGIRNLAAKVAPGMQPEGQMAKGTLAEGQHLQFLYNLLPGKCYTIIGYGVGMQNLDLNLFFPPYTLLAAQDNSTSDSPVIGRAPSPICPMLQLAIAYKVDIYAQKGGGNVGVQIYSKNK
jgi:hypothetical protein